MSAEPTPHDIWCFRLAATEQNLDELHKFLNYFPGCVDARAGTDSTALVAAVFQGHLDVVKILVKAGADLEQLGQDNDGYPLSPLGYAIKQNHAEIVDYLIEKGVCLNGKDSGLLRALQAHDINLLDKMLKLNPPLEARDERGYTVLHMMAETRYNYSLSEAIRLMAGTGTDMNVRADNGRTPLMVFARSNENVHGGNAAVMSQLIVSGADVDLPDDQGNDFESMLRALPHQDMYECYMEIKPRLLPAINKARALRTVGQIKQGVRSLPSPARPRMKGLSR